MNRLKAVVAGWLLLVAASPLWAQFQSDRVQVIDRGQADGILIRPPNEQWIVIDAGTNNQQADAMATQGVMRVALVIKSGLRIRSLLRQSTTSRPWLAASTWSSAERTN